MRDGFRDLDLREPIVHPDIHVTGQLSHFPRSNQ